MNEHIMFIQIDKDGIINEVSIAFSDFLGYSRSELWDIVINFLYLKI